MEERRNKIWFLLLCCAYCVPNAINLTSGIYFIHFQYSLGASASEAAFAVGLPTSILFLCGSNILLKIRLLQTERLSVNFLLHPGPIYTSIYNHLGYKRAFLLSAILLSVGFIGTAFSHSIGSIFFLWGACIGFGGGLCHLACFSIIGQVFHQKRSLAFNTASTSGMVVAFALGPAMQYFIDAYNWRGASLLIGAFVLNTIPAILITDRFYIPKRVSKDLRRMPPEQNPRQLSQDETDQDNETLKNTNLSSSVRPRGCLNKNSKLTTTLDFSLLLDVLFLCYAVAMACSITAVCNTGFYLVRYAQDIQLEDYAAVWLLSIVRTADMIVCPVVGLLSSYCTGSYEWAGTGVIHSGQYIHDQADPGEDTRRNKTRCSIRAIRRSYFLAVMQFLLALLLLLPTLAEHYFGFLTYAILNGIVAGAIGALPVAVLADFFGGKRFSSALGFRSALAGIWFLFFPYLTGILIERTGTFRPAQYISCGLAITASILTVITEISFQRRQTKLEQ